MFDPDPPVNLPNGEFVEIFNRSNKTFDLSGWTFNGVNSSASCGSDLLAPGAYLILCDNSFHSSFSVYGARDYDEVKNTGARHSSTRSADQTAAAVFWIVQTAVPWHAAARAVSAAKGLSVADNAKMFAMLALATADSQIVAFAEKYKRPHWRPITAIRSGVGADAGATPLERDAKWEPLLGTPPHPEYPSAHAIFSGAAEVVLRAWLGGDDLELSVTSPPVFGITRSYRMLSQITEEVENARVWGGIHFRSADRDGIEVGRKIGTLVVREFPTRGSL